MHVSPYMSEDEAGTGGVIQGQVSSYNIDFGHTTL